MYSFMNNTDSFAILKDRNYFLHVPLRIPPFRQLCPLTRMRERSTLPRWKFRKNFLYIYIHVYTVYIWVENTNIQIKDILR